MVYHGAATDLTLKVPWQGHGSCKPADGGFYPVTQIYQHDADRRDGVNTISMLLGKRGTFIFCAVLYAAAFVQLFIYFQQQQQLPHFLVLQVFFIPVYRCFFQVAATGLER